MSRPVLSSVLIGGESLLIGCARHWKGQGHEIRAVVSAHPEVAAFARAEGIPLFAPGADLSGLAGFDWLLSIANLHLIPAEVLAMPRKGAVNFHDGPLPRRAGLNAPVWALLEGDPRHGITWHLIEGGVDEGRIITRSEFDIAPDDTAFTLNTRAFAAAMESFPAVVNALEADLPELEVQDTTGRALHLRADRPEAMALLDFTKPAADLARLVRALDHGGYRNPLTLPKLRSATGVFAVQEAEALPGHGRPGTVLSAKGAPGEGELLIASGEGAIRLSGLTCLKGLPVAGADVAHPEELLPRPETAALDQAMARIAVGEAGWAQRLAAFQPFEIHAGKGEGGTRALAIPALQAAEALMRFAPGGIALLTPELEETRRLAPGLIAEWLPLAGDLAAELSRANRYPGYALDLIAREPGLSAPERPDLALSFTGAPLQGAALSLIAEGETCRLSSETLSQPDLDLWAARAMGDTSFEAALMARLNDTATPFDNRTLPALFEARVDLHPEAVALVQENTALNYAELDARANKVAHVLRGMGVGPDVPVGLCIRRSPAMLIGALAILKAGGAYVPMDPAYPAERLAHFVKDSGAPVVLTEAALFAQLPPHGAKVLVIDTDSQIAAAPETRLPALAEPQNLAYLIYTSGSTGLPKGVMVEHRNVANFFTGMDAHLRHEPNAVPSGVWLSLTSLSFDISVLELFWTLARGFKIVLTSDQDRLALSSGAPAVSAKAMEFSLFYWGNDDGPGPKKYELLLEGAKFADQNGFSAVWTPERHFHAFGGPYPNPSVTGAAVAAVTKNLAVRAGSCVAPLHHPMRIAEEWAVIDNLTNGRTGLGIASGWHPVDFLLRPENAPPNNKAAMLQTIDTLRKLWRGEAVEFDRGNGQMEAVQSLPRPVSKELPLWITTAGNPDTWREAGRLGANVLTHLLGQSIEEVAGKIGIYHAALREAGHDPARFKVTLMLHTYLAADRETAREIAREPMKGYLRASAALVQQYAWAFPAFKRPQGVDKPVELDLRSLGDEELDAILDFAFERYFEESGLFGTVGDALERLEALKAIGVQEIACLIDYGIETATVLESLRPLAEALRLTNAGSAPAEDDFTLAAQIRRHGVSHLQCTPTMARMLLADEGSRAALREVEQVMLGGEALPGALAAEFTKLTGNPVLNMYGPTETTIWSTCGPASGGAGVAALGAPIANTTLHVLDDARQPVPVGVEGELWIGGEGVTRGYWNRAELTADRFIRNPFGPDSANPGRIYGTGDKVRIRADGGVDFLGRGDGQVKIRGHRIELGEIEAAIDAQAGVSGSVVLARPAPSGEVRLVAWVTGSARPEALSEALARQLPAHMRPARIVHLEAFPETPNRKIDRKALPEPEALAAPKAPKPAEAPAVSQAALAENTDTVAEIARVWSGVLGVGEIKPSDHFFQLGGHSLLAVQAHRELRAALGLPGLSITDVFRFPLLADLARHIETRFGGAQPAPQARPAPVALPLASPAAPVSALASPPPPSDPGAAGRLDAMARRRAMRAGRGGA